MISVKCPHCGKDVPLSLTNVLRQRIELKIAELERDAKTKSSDYAISKSHASKVMINELRLLLK